MRIIPADCKEIWNETVKSYKKWDVYYLHEYAVSFQNHGDGIPFLIEFEMGSDRFCYVVMRRDISMDSNYVGVLDKDEYYDLETPYGYGGPLCDGDYISDKGLNAFSDELYEYAHENRIVSQFVRFHPILANHHLLANCIETRYLHKTVYIDTSSRSLIDSNMDGKNRNMVRKAIRSGILIEKKPISDYDCFLGLYEETMLKNNAESYYFFDKTYFDDQELLDKNACIFYALKDGVIISGAIIYFNERYMNYHLAGTRTEFRKYSPNNLLLYEAALWGCSMGVQSFHLGGGLSEDDALFGFKKQFNKNGYLPFYIGRTVFDKRVYRRLLSVRKKNDCCFDENNSRMIQYR